MEKESLTNFSQRAIYAYAKLPLWVIVPTACMLYLGSEVYNGIRGRFDRSTRETATQFMMEEAFFRGYSHSPALWFWSRKDRQEARESIQEALGLRHRRNEYYDSMSDEEMAAHVEQVVEGFQEAIRPMNEINKRMN